MWMRCATLEEIAAAEDVDHKTVSAVLGEMADLPKLPKHAIAAAEHATEDFDPPLYNVWKQQTKSGCPRKTVDDQIATFGDSVLQNQTAQSA
jgi:hypothetical protein